LFLSEEPIHFVGIGGIGMSGIAKILLEMGVKVSGSDLKNSDILERLQDLGARIFIGHSAQNVIEDTHTVVYSSAVPQDNPEILEARKRGLTLIPRAEMLARLMAGQESIAIAGAHGKTTTTAMISLVLEINNYDPTIIIGGELKQIGSNAKFGSGRYLVAEADESDGSFLILHPKMCVITNIENDHLDYYRSVKNIVSAFGKFVEQLPADGFAVFCLDDKELEEIKHRISGNYITYSVLREDADFVAKNIFFRGTQSWCDVYHRGEKLGQLELLIPGIHNISNALAAVAVAKKLGLSFQQIKDGLKQFPGVKRRFELIGRTNGITVVDDYAHHPTELKATIKAAKNAGFKRVVAVFQPHRFTRTKLLQFEFGESFHDADLIVINEIYSASEKPIPGVSAHLIVNAIKACSNKEVKYFSLESEIIKYLKDEAKPGDIVLTLGAGNIRQAGIKLVHELQSGGQKF